MAYMFYNAGAFNQPLSFDTSSVTDMHGMFEVRSSPCPAPNQQSRPFLRDACTADARHPPAPPRTSLRTRCRASQRSTSR